MDFSIARLGAIMAKEVIQLNNTYEANNNLAINHLILDYLHNKGVSCQLIENKEIEHDLLIRSVILTNLGSDQLIMAILPEQRLLEYSVLCNELNEKLELATEKDLSKFMDNFPEFEFDYFPPLPSFFELKAIVDASLLEFNYLYFKLPVNKNFIKIKSKDFLSLLDAIKILDFSTPTSSLHNFSHHNQIEQFTAKRMQQRLDDLYELPAMPPMVGQILKLMADPNTTAMQLANLIEKDPSLSMQLINWAQSPYYGYQGRVTSVECAIVKVLGFNLVVNLALGVAIGKTIKAPMHGPLGLGQYWKFAIYCGALIDQLILKMPRSNRPIRGLAYLCGLLHNFGFLILAQVFLPHFELLNHYVRLNPNVCVTKIERHILKVTHEDIGYWLMQSWDMPKELIFATKWHHQMTFVEPYAIYSNLVLVATRLLKRAGLGDSSTEKIPPEVLNYLGFNEQDALDALDFVLNNSDNLDEIVEQII